MLWERDLMSWERDKYFFHMSPQCCRSCMTFPDFHIPRFSILFLEELFLIFNQMLSIRALGRRVRGGSMCNGNSFINPSTNGL